MIVRGTTVALVAALAGCAQPTPEQRFVDDAAAALGGRARVASVHTFTASGEGTQYNLGQDLRPGAATQTFAVSEYRRRMDLDTGRARIALTRTPAFAYFQGPEPQRQEYGVDGPTVFTVNAAGSASRVSGQAAFDRHIEAAAHPLAILHAAVAPDAVVTNVRDEDGARMADITVSPGLTFTMALDTAGRPTSASIKAPHPNLGDVVVRTEFSDYQAVRDLQLPSHIVTKVDDFTTADLRLAPQQVDQGAGPDAAPADLPAVSPAAPSVAVEPVAKGLWRLAGQSHHSVLVEFADHLTLIEAPQSEARTLAVIAAARALVPGKPLTELVMTHHHFDHSAGLRAAIAEGLTVITQAGNRAFVEEMAGRPHTIEPDALARNPKPLAVRVVDSELALRDASMAMTLYHVAGNPHSETMLMAYFPASRVLVEVDAFTPGARVQPYAANLLDNITSRKLRVDRIVPLHGDMAPFGALPAAVP